MLYPEIDITDCSFVMYYKFTAKVENFDLTSDEPW